MIGEPLCDRFELSVLVVTYEHVDEVRECLKALQRQTLRHELIVIDNSPSDVIERLIRAEFQEAVLIRSGVNDGYAGGNNRGLQFARGANILILNPDTVPQPDALAHMHETLMRHPGSVITAKLVGDDGKINAMGNRMHFSGIVTCAGLGEEPTRWSGDQPVYLASGAAILASRDTWTALEGFDASYFLYMEDADVSLRARLQGREIWCAADAEIRHHYQLNLTAAKFYYLYRNRIMTLEKIFAPETLRRRRVGLLLTEGLIAAFALSRGPAYWRSFWRARRWLKRPHRIIMWRRQALCAQRVVADSVLDQGLDIALPFDQLVSKAWLGRWMQGMTAPILRWTLRGQAASL
jgi:GT2 family glycosyltransferase